jgi:hypothetical protein
VVGTASPTALELGMDGGSANGRIAGAAPES